MERSDPDDEFEDPLADSLLSGDVYRRLRVERSLGVGWSTGTRLRAQALIAGSLALAYPLGRLSPAVGESPVVLLAGLFGALVAAFGAVLVGGVAIARLRAGAGLTETTAEELVTLEDMATMLSLVTGGGAVAATHAVLVAAVLAPEGLQAVMRRDPFTPSGTPLTLAAVAAGALVVAATIALLSRWVDARLT